MSFSQALEALRKQEGDLFVTEFSDGTSVPFRLLTNKKAAQYQLILTLSTDNISLTNTIYEDIFRQCCEDKYLSTQCDSIPAGVPQAIGKLVLYLSGVTTTNESILYTRELLKAYRSQINTYKELIQRVICSVFSGYKFSDLESLNYQELIKIYVQAEKLLLEQGIIEKELEIKTPEELAEEAEKKKQKIGDMIQQDLKDYNRFERDTGPAPNLKDLQMEKIKAQEKVKEKKQSVQRAKAEEAMRRRKK